MSLREIDFALMERDQTHRRLLAFRIEGLPCPAAADFSSSWRTLAAEAARRDMASRRGRWPIAGAVCVDLGLDFPQAPPNREDVEPLARLVLESLVEAGALASADQAEEVRLIVEEGALEEACGLTVAVWQERTAPPRPGA